MTFPDPDQIELFKKTPGAASVCEMIYVAHLAEMSPDEGIHVDCGSNAGKFAMSAAIGLARKGKPSILHCIDPVFDLENERAVSQMCQKKKENIGWGWVFEPDFKEKFIDRILTVSKGLVTPVLVGQASLDGLPMLHNQHGKFSYIYLDCDNHTKELVDAEVDYVKDKMIHDGVLAWHDFGNQFHAPRESYWRLMAEGTGWEEIPRPWEVIVPWVKERDLEKGNDTWHACDQEFPTFVGALKKP